ncbi:MAG: hypothetical protein JW841_10725 [Deltaproteobacteria bacterium]|nr:hypothetical protein [Deltaproteobacteria bacterium]
MNKSVYIFLPIIIVFTCNFSLAGPFAAIWGKHECGCKHDPLYRNCYCSACPTSFSVSSSAILSPYNNSLYGGGALRLEYLEHIGAGAGRLALGGRYSHAPDAVASWAFIETGLILVQVLDVGVGFGAALLADSKSQLPYGPHVMMGLRIPILSIGELGFWLEPYYLSRAVFNDNKSIFVSEYALSLVVTSLPYTKETSATSIFETDKCEKIDDAIPISLGGLVAYSTQTKHVVGIEASLVTWPWLSAGLRIGPNSGRAILYPYAEIGLLSWLINLGFGVTMTVGDPDIAKMYAHGFLGIALPLNDPHALGSISTGTPYIQFYYRPMRAVGKHSDIQHEVGFLFKIMNIETPH